MNQKASPQLVWVEKTGVWNDDAGEWAVSRVVLWPVVRVNGRQLAVVVRQQGPVAASYV